MTKREKCKVCGKPYRPLGRGITPAEGDNYCDVSCRGRYLENAECSSCGFVHDSGRCVGDR